MKNTKNIDNRKRKKIIICAGLISALLAILLFIFLRDDEPENTYTNNTAASGSRTEKTALSEPSSISRVEPEEGIPPENRNNSGTLEYTPESTDYDPRKKKTLYSPDLKDGDVLASGRTVHWDDDLEQWYFDEPFVEDTSNDANPYTRYAEYDSLDDLRNAGVEYPQYSQDVLIEVKAEKNHKQMRLVFNWLDTSCLLNAFNLYNSDKTLEYNPVSQRPGEIVYVINDVKAGDVFYFHLDAPYLGGYTFVQDDEQEYRQMMDGDSSYYGDWVNDPSEVE